MAGHCAFMARTSRSQDLCIEAFLSSSLDPTNKHLRFRLVSDKLKRYIILPLTQDYIYTSWVKPWGNFFTPTPLRTKPAFVLSSPTPTQTLFASKPKDCLSITTAQSWRLQHVASMSTSQISTIFGSKCSFDQVMWRLAARTQTLLQSSVMSMSGGS